MTDLNSKVNIVLSPQFKILINFKRWKSIKLKQWIQFKVLVIKVHKDDFSQYFVWQTSKYTQSLDSLIY